MPEYTAKIRAKGLDGTGVTEDVAREMYAHKGRYYMAVVEVEVVERHDGDHYRTDLVIKQFEPAAHGGDVDAHLRGVTAAAYQNRKLKSDSDQLSIETQEDLNPSVQQVIEARADLRPHEYEVGPGKEPFTAACMVCGEDQAAPLHREQTGLPDPFAVPDDEEPGEEPEVQEEGDGS